MNTGVEQKNIEQNTPHIFSTVDARKIAVKEKQKTITAPILDICIYFSQQKKTQPLSNRKFENSREKKK